jgi:hypothetical protein
MKEYIELPLSFAMVSKLFNESISATFGQPYNLVPYTQTLMDEIFSLPKVKNDLDRTHFLIGDADALYYCPKQSDTQAYITNLQQRAKKNGVNLTTEQTQAIYCFAVSTCGEWMQGGLYVASYMALTVILDRLGNPWTLKNYNYHITQTADGKIELTTKINCRGLLNEDKEDDYIYAEQSFLLTEKDGNFNLLPQNNKSFVRIQKTLMEERLLPMALTVLAKQEASGLTREFIGLYTPFLIYPEFANAYINFLVKQPMTTIESAKDFIRVCFAQDKKQITRLFEKIFVLQRSELNKAIETSANDTKSNCAKDIISQFQKLDHQSYATYDEALTVILKNTTLALNAKDKKQLQSQLCRIEMMHCDIAQANLTAQLSKRSVTDLPAQSAIQVVADIMQLDRKTRIENHVLLTDVMKNISDVLSSSDQPESFAKTEQLINSLKTREWGKVIAGSLLAFLGVAVLVLSVGAAIASFGSSSFISYIGLSIAANVLTQSVAICSGVAGIAVAATGVSMMRTTPLRQFAQSSASFWKKKSFVVQDNVDARHELSVTINSCSTSV